MAAMNIRLLSLTETLLLHVSHAEIFSLSIEPLRPVNGMRRRRALPALSSGTSAARRATDPNRINASLVQKANSRTVTRALTAARREPTLSNLQANVCAKPIMFIDEKQKKSPQFAGIPFNSYGTISVLTAFKSPPPFVIALVVCPANPVGITVEQWASAPMHCNVLVVVSTPKVLGRRSGGKAVVVCEPNITDVEAREDIAKHIIHNRVLDMLKHMKRSSSQVWVNNKREVRNNAGICLRLALEWMVELAGRIR
ncbi:hypothetical protein R3P38DRAFT_2786818 [Favolaschia claudopus]|uniref:Uncharacterized protein n=1 Tax=Favolaschia claudopus TaxID=2862362 RepID=A0AAW0AQL0_9AGAR